MKYAFIGTGGVGGYFGGKLAQHGFDVHFLARSDYLHMKDYGLRVDSVGGSFTLPEVNVYDNRSQMPRCDVVCVCIKTTANDILLEIIPPIVHDDSIVIIIQNGLGMEDELAQFFPGMKIAGGLVYLCSTKIGPGHIDHQDFGTISFAPRDTGDLDFLENIVADFTSAGIQSDIKESLLKTRWIKLVWNVPYNGLTVVHNTTTADLMKQPDSRALVRDLMLEIIHGGRACGLEMEESLVDVMMDFTDGMKPYAPSMKVDFDNRRPMEIEYIYTRPVLEARKAGFDMKKVEMLEKELRFIQESYMS